MELPILKIFMLLLLSITTNAKITNIDEKLFSDICSKAILPKKCAFYLRLYHKDGASSLEDIGARILRSAIVSAKDSMNLFNQYAKKDYIAKKFYLKAKYEICGEKYKLAMDKLSEAKELLKAEKFAEARDNLEDASKVPTYCENLTRSKSGDVVLAYQDSDFMFDVALAIVRYLERHTRKSSTAALLT